MYPTPKKKACIQHTTTYLLSLTWIMSKDEAILGKKAPKFLFFILLFFYFFFTNKVFRPLRDNLAISLGICNPFISHTSNYYKEKSLGNSYKMLTRDFEFQDITRPLKPLPLGLKI